MEREAGGAGWVVEQEQDHGDTVNAEEKLWNQQGQEAGGRQSLTARPVVHLLTTDSTPQPSYSHHGRQNRPPQLNTISKLSHQLGSK